MAKVIEGSFVAVPLKNGEFGVGRVLTSPLMCFYLARFPGMPKTEDIISIPIAFSVWVMEKPIKSGRWKIIGQQAIEENFESPFFYKKDLHSKKFFRYRNGESFPSSYEECIGLENAAVWGESHIEERLEDETMGRENAWTALLKAKQ